MGRRDAALSGATTVTWRVIPGTRITQSLAGSPRVNATSVVTMLCGRAESLQGSARYRETPAPGRSLQAMRGQDLARASGDEPNARSLRGHAAYRASTDFCGEASIRHGRLPARPEATPVAGSGRLTHVPLDHRKCPRARRTAPPNWIRRLRQAQFSPRKSGLSLGGRQTPASPVAPKRNSPLRRQIPQPRQRIRPLGRPD